MKKGGSVDREGIESKMSVAARRIIIIYITFDLFPLSFILSPLHPTDFSKLSEIRQLFPLRTYLHFVYGTRYGNGINVPTYV